MKDPRDERAKTALKKMGSITHRACNPYTREMLWPGGLHFTEAGAARLANIAGLVVGLEMAGRLQGDLEQLATSHGGGPGDLARRLALSLDDRLLYLSRYGGQKEIPVDGGQQVVKVPAFKVLLGDDGSLGGFTLSWYKPYTIEEVKALARTYDNAAYLGYEEDETVIGDDEIRERWDAALYKAKEKMGLRDDLEERRHFTPTWVTQKREAIELAHVDHLEEWQHSCNECPSTSHLGGSSEWIRYGYSFNGGLLLHGMGSPTFSIRLGSDSGPSWSIHT